MGKEWEMGSGNAYWAGVGNLILCSPVTDKDNELSFSEHLSPPEN